MPHIVININVIIKRTSRICVNDRLIGNKIEVEVNNVDKNHGRNNQLISPEIKIATTTIGKYIEKNILIFSLLV